MKTVFRAALSLLLAMALAFALPMTALADNPFTDVPNGQYYCDAVLWAVGRSPQVTNGIDATHFRPDSVCTRAQVVTFLWRAAGKPEPSTAYNPFSDVKSGVYYYKAVIWAVEKGVAKGTGEKTFRPDAPCTRGQVVTFLHRALDSPAPGDAAVPFTDVASGQYYYDAVRWALGHSPQITNGTDATHFSPDSPCTRGQIVTFLYRAMA